MPKQDVNKNATKSELLLDVAKEATYSRSPSAAPLVIIPNHPIHQKPVALLGNPDFTAWLTWRCFNKHGFLPATVTINVVMRYLTGVALFGETSRIWDGQCFQGEQDTSITTAGTKQLSTATKSAQRERMDLTRPESKESLPPPQSPFEYTTVSTPQIQV